MQRLLIFITGKGERQKAYSGYRRRLKRRFALTEDGKNLIKALSGMTVAAEEISQLTPAMLKDRSWRGKRFQEIQYLPSSAANYRRQKTPLQGIS